MTGWDLSGMHERAKRHEAEGETARRKTGSPWELSDAELKAEAGDPDVSSYRLYELREEQSRRREAAREAEHEREYGRGDEDETPWPV